MVGARNKKLIGAKRVAIAAAALFFVSVLALRSARIKDIAKIQGSRGVQVIGYGLAAGLNNTGDSRQSYFTIQSIRNMLKRFGITVPQANARVRNVAAVMVTATVPAFSKPGAKIDVVVSSLGDATSLQGGALLMTPLTTQTGEFVGMAQGPVSVGGYDFSSLGSRVGKNFVTTGRVPGGLILQNEIKSSASENGVVQVLLDDPDFTTAANVAKAINGALGANSAKALDAASIKVSLPKGADLVSTISKIENLPINKTPPARVALNERTGTIVIGGDVQLLPAVIAHGGLEIQIQKRVLIAQPPPYPVIMPSAIDPNLPLHIIVPPSTIAETARVSAEERSDSVRVLQVASPTAQDLANALNALKVKPRDLIAIFQALKEAGVLQAELIIQ